MGTTASSSTANSKRTQLFVQSVTLNGTEIPRSMIQTTVYIEHGKLSAPQLVMDVRDSTNYLISKLGLQHGSILACSLGDPDGKGGIVFKETFYVLKAPHHGDMTRIYAFSNPVRLLKEKATKPQFYVSQQPAKIISSLTDLKVDADTFTKTGTYHLNMGEKPSLVLSSIARDAAAMIWAGRGNIHCKGMAKLFSGKPVMTYEANNPKADHAISRFAVINNDKQYSAPYQYRLASYSMTEGVVYSGDASLPVKFVSNADKTVMKNMHTYLIPKFDMIVPGNAALTPGVLLKVLVNTYDGNNALDESVPTNMVVMQVAHREDRKNYVSRAILGVLNG